MRICYLAMVLVLSITAQAQTADPVKTVIVACQPGDLYIDGELIAKIEADDARKEALKPGEHYIQLKTAVGKINTTVTIDANRSDIIRLGCKEAPASESSIKLIEKKLYLTGLLAPTADENLVGLDNDDQLLVTCSVLDKKGTANVVISNLHTGQEVFRRQNFSQIQGEGVRIPAKGVYYVKFTTDALVGKNVQFALHRVPGPNSKPGFRTTVSLKADTAFQEIMTTTTRVYSQGNLSHPNKTAVKINLPENTSYWAYWIGVDQTSKDEMKRLCERLSGVGELVSANPVVLLGLNLLPSLPVMNSTETISYRYMSTPHSTAFVNGQGYQYYTFKYGDHVSADYSIVSQVPKDLALTMENKNALTGLDVDIRVVAFIVTKKWVMDAE